MTARRRWRGRAQRDPVQPEERKIPAGQARRRSRTAVTLSLAALAVIWIVPALALRPLADPAPLAFGTGIVVGIGVMLVRGTSNALGSRRSQTATLRFLTASTRTGLRTIDVRNLKRVRARRLAGRYGHITYLVVTDASGVRISFRSQQDIRFIRCALKEGERQPQHTIEVKVSRLAKDAMGVQPLPRGVSPLWSLASAELYLLIMLGCAFTIIGIASA